MDTHVKRFSIDGKDYGVYYLGGMALRIICRRCAWGIFTFASKNGSCTSMTSAIAPMRTWG
jgi:hypothetical protein